VLIFTSVAGWLASSAAQIIGIAANKSYTKEQKKFMLHQESADALINIGSFFVITKSFKAVSSKLVSTGKIAPKAVVDLLEKNGQHHRRGTFDFDVTSVDNFDKVKNVYNGFKCFADSTAAVVGGVLSSNILTPILRNEYASHKQKQYIALQNKTPKNTTINTPRHTFSDFTHGTLSV
jgi:hypothetical protein